MKIHKTIRYKIKNLLPMLTIAGVALAVPASCSKPDPMPEQKKEMEVQFDDEYNEVEHTIILSCAIGNITRKNYIAQNQR